MGLEAVINWVISIWRFITPAHWISPWEGGVRITHWNWLRPLLWRLTPENRVTELQPGTHFKLPLLQRVHQTVTASQPLNLPPQSCTTSDGKRFNAGLVVLYSIKSVLWFFTRIHDQDQYLRDASLGATADVINRHTLDWLIKNMQECKAEVLEEIKKSVRGKGYEIEGAKFSDYQAGNSLRLMMGDGYDAYNPS